MINDIIENYRRTTIRVLKQQIEYFQDQIPFPKSQILAAIPHGHMNIVIHALEKRIKELENPENPIVS